MRPLRTAGRAQPNAHPIIGISFYFFNGGAMLH